MPQLSFTRNIQRHIACPTLDVDAVTVREALELFFSANPLARGYILDDQGGLRRHMAIYVDGALIRDRAGQTDPVRSNSHIAVFQALSGG